MEGRCPLQPLRSWRFEVPLGRGGDVKDESSVPECGRPPGEGNGSPLQCSCLESPRDGGAWWAAVCGVAQSRHDWSSLAAAAVGRGFQLVVAGNVHKAAALLHALLWFLWLPRSPDPGL